MNIHELAIMVNLGSFVQLTMYASSPLFNRVFVHAASKLGWALTQADGRPFHVGVGLKIFVCKPLTCRRIPFWIFGSTHFFFEKILTFCHSE